MASKVVIFPALLLLSMLSTSSMAYHHQAVARSPGEYCFYPGAYPSHDNPLRGCRTVVKSQCLGVPVAENVKAACCRQLAAVEDSWCKCEAVGTMLDIMHKELGVTAATGKQTEVFPGCRREALQRAAANIPAFCRQWIPNPAGGVQQGGCYWVDYPVN